MEVVGATIRCGLAEPVHFRRSVRGVSILNCCQRLDARARRAEVGDPGKNVDDRLRVKSGDACAADVMHATGDPSADRLFQQRALLLEAPRPRRIGSSDANPFITGLAHGVIVGVEAYAWARGRTKCVRPQGVHSVPICGTWRYKHSTPPGSRRTGPTARDRPVGPTAVRPCCVSPELDVDEVRGPP